MQLLPHEVGAIKTLIETLQRNVAIADLSSDELGKLGAAYTDLAGTVPELAGKVQGYADRAAMVLAYRDIKTGEGGTWKQRTTRRRAEVEKLIAGRRT